MSALSKKIKNNTLLIATPFLWEDSFRRTVVLVTEHSAEGTHGFILNRPLGVGVQEIFGDSFPKIEAMVYEGGPVETDTLHFLHNVGDLISDSHRVGNGIWWGGDFEEVKFLIEQQLITAENIRFFIGYAGWEAGQLAAEMEERHWLTSEGDANYVFRLPSNDVWKQALATISEQHRVIGTMPDTEFWN